jgi:hypothetical protein
VPVTRARSETEIRLWICAAVGGGKASKGSRRIARNSVRNGTKRGEPQDRQRPAMVAASWRVNRRGGEKPRGRIADGNGLPIPKGRRSRAETLGRGCPGDGLRGLYDGGAIFGQPQERKPGRDVGRHGSGSSSGKAAPRSRGARTFIFTGGRAARSAVPRGPRGSRKRVAKVEEGGGQDQPATTSIGNTAARSRTSLKTR